MRPPQEGVEVTRRGPVICLVKQEPGRRFCRVVRPSGGRVGETPAQLMPISWRTGPLGVAIKLLLPAAATVTPPGEA